MQLIALFWLATERSQRNQETKAINQKPLMLDYVLSPWATSITVSSSGRKWPVLNRQACFGIFTA